MHPLSPLALTAFAGLALVSATCAAQSVTVYGRLALTTNQVETGNTSKEMCIRDR